MKKSSKSPVNQVSSLFCTFLKRNNAYDSFVRNSSDSRVFPIDWLKDIIPECYILFAFRWASTPEGRKYWSLLNDKWKLALNLFNF